MKDFENDIKSCLENKAKVVSIPPPFEIGFNCTKFGMQIFYSLRSFIMAVSKNKGGVWMVK